MPKPKKKLESTYDKWTSDSSDSISEPLYADINESNTSSDSGYSEKCNMNNPHTYLTSDDLTLITRYEKVLRNRKKKSRFQKLSELLCSGGSNSDDEFEENETDIDSLYDSLQSFYVTSPSSYATESSEDEFYDMSTSMIGSSSPTDTDTTVRYSKHSFFYKRCPYKDLSKAKYDYDATVEYVPTDRFTRSTLLKQIETPRKPPKPNTIDRSQHLYENYRDFTTSYDFE